MMNWIIILIGNLLMDLTIGAFAILSVREARFRRIAERGRISEESLEEKVESKRRELESLLEEDELSSTDKIKKYVKEKKDEIIIDAYRESLRDKYIKKAGKISPVTGIKSWIISIAFIVGGILQVVGISID